MDNATMAMDLLNFIEYILDQVGQVPEIVAYCFFCIPSEIQIVMYIGLIIFVIAGLIQMLKKL